MEHITICIANYYVLEIYSLSLSIGSLGRRLRVLVPLSAPILFSIGDRVVAVIVLVKILLNDSLSLADIVVGEISELED